MMSVHWIAGHSWLSHPLVALAIMLGLTLALWRVCSLPHWIGAAVAAGFYWGREKRDHEARLRLPPSETWNQGILPWEWSRKSQIDFLAPALTVLLLALAIELWRRRIAASTSRPNAPPATPLRNPSGLPTSGPSEA